MLIRKKSNGFIGSGSEQPRLSWMKLAACDANTFYNFVSFQYFQRYYERVLHQITNKRIINQLYKSSQFITMTNSYS